MRWIKRLFGEAPSPSAAALDLHREMQSLHLELAERDARIATLEQDLERYRSSERAGNEASKRLTRWLESAAAPASQLRTQAHLVQVEEKPVQAHDVLAVARQLLRTLEDAGMEFEGEIDQVVEFDPDRHRPLSEANPRRGDRVRIRFVAVRLGERIVYKAGVVACNEGDCA